MCCVEEDKKQHIYSSISIIIEWGSPKRREAPRNDNNRMGYLRNRRRGRMFVYYSEVYNNNKPSIPSKKNRVQVLRIS